VVLADLREASARAAAEKLVGAGHQAVAIGCDIADDAQVAAMVDRIVVTFGRLDAAFNSAGMSPRPETVDLGNGARASRVALRPDGVARRVLTP
jgi:NAD(P)-dependent dehydrogenase (short-subunit alcohol dehydrogenase family)